MNREKLIKAFEQTATAEGYAFYSAEDRYLPQMVKQHPAIWLSPPEFYSMEGNRHGSATYTVTLHALHRGAKSNEKQRREIGAELEQSILDIFSSLTSFDFVAEVDKLRIRHSSHTLTAHGDVAATATAEVITIF